MKESPSNNKNVRFLIPFYTDKRIHGMFEEGHNVNLSQHLGIKLNKERN